MLTWNYGTINKENIMKKFLLYVIAAIVLIIYAGFRYVSVPAFTLEKKLMINEAGIELKTEVQQASLKVMTYNIHRGINRSNKLDLDGITEVIISSNPDIIALQEVERFSIRTRFRDQIEYIAEKLSMNYAYGKSINILNGQYGNAILSKFPIEEYEVKQLPSEHENRTLLKTVLNIYGSRVSVCNTHLGLKKSERDNQITEIMNITADEERLILAGDFNSNVDKLGAVTEKLRDSAEYDKKKYKTPTFESKGITERIDYIFVSEEFRLKGYKVLESEASDHNPVISILKLSD